MAAEKSGLYQQLEEGQTQQQQNPGFVQPPPYSATAPKASPSTSAVNAPTTKYQSTDVGMHSIPPQAMQYPSEQKRTVFTRANDARRRTTSWLGRCCSSTCSCLGFSFFNMVALSIFLCGIGDIMAAIFMLVGDKYRDVNRFLEAFIGDDSVMPVGGLESGVLAMGILAALSAFLGFYSMNRQNKRHFNIYMGMLFVTFLGSVVLLGLNFGSRKYSDFDVCDSEISDYRPGGGLQNILIDSIQEDYFCCGFNGPEDYVRCNAVLPRDSLPSSCCPSWDDNCDFSSYSSYSRGCYERTLSKASPYVLCSSATTAFFTFVALLVSLSAMKLSFSSSQATA